MNQIVVGMGEALWDCLPEGKKIEAFLRKNIQYFVTVGINTYCTDYTAVKTEL